MCLATLSITVLFYIACNGGYSGWVLSQCPISKSLHQPLTFDISGECIKFSGHMTSCYRDICMKVTPQSIWIHCRFLMDFTFSALREWNIRLDSSLFPLEADWSCHSKPFSCNSGSSNSWNKLPPLRPPRSWFNRSKYLACVMLKHMSF